MSFYNVYDNPNPFVVKDPALLISTGITMLNSSIVIPNTNTVVSDVGSTTITADALLSGLVIRTNVGPVTDLTDSATNIINALRRKIHEIKSNDVVTMPNGTSFTFKLFNNTNQDPYEVFGGAGVTFGNSDGKIVQGNATVFTIIVTGQTALGDAANTISIINGDY